jgi:hypothetical protein
MSDIAEQMPTPTPESIGMLPPLVQTRQLIGQLAMVDKKTYGAFVNTTTEALHGEGDIIYATRAAIAGLMGVAATHLTFRETRAPVDDGYDDAREPQIYERRAILWRVPPRAVTTETSTMEAVFDRPQTIAEQEKEHAYTESLIKIFEDDKAQPSKRRMYEYYPELRILERLFIDTNTGTDPEAHKAIRRLFAAHIGATQAPDQGLRRRLTLLRDTSTVHLQSDIARRVRQVETARQQNLRQNRSSRPVRYNRLNGV